MTDNFPAFAEIVANSFQAIAGCAEVFVADVDGDDLYQAYLEAFPEGTNPLFKERTEHDCSCCKQFIRRVGNVLAIQPDGAVRTVWGDAQQSAPYPYNEVAAVLDALVFSSDIVDIFRVHQSEGSFGAKVTRSLNEAGDVLSWNHFYSGVLPDYLRAFRPDEAKGRYRTTVQVFERGLRELSHDALETVLALIDANNLYRGEEHRPALADFMKAKAAYDEAEDPNLYVWEKAGAPAARFRNTVIGTLVTDLSDGMDIEQAVRSFETKVAPQNYKRTSAVITPGMVKSAMQTIQLLGLEPALERRFARIDDISVNDVLWVDSSVKPLMKDGIGEVLMREATVSRDHAEDEGKAEPIAMDDFIARILPEANGMEVLFKGEHLGNLMSLTAPIHPDPVGLFRWNNDFAWSYAGNIADSSIKERVKQAGGRVTGVQLRCSLSWWNFDDLDIHVRGPGGHIHFHRKRGSCGGQLDIDMNVQPDTREAVENVVWERVPDGVYNVSVHNYTHRESIDVGFVVEVENRGAVTQYNYPREVRSKAEIQVVTLTVKGGAVVDAALGDPNITTNAVSQDRWGLKTETYVPVNAVTLSPNHWGENAVGNKHTFFVLEGCLNDEPTRGIYNEFLHPRLMEHRKVFEIIGDKTKCQPTEGQLSGLGFSSTKKDSVVVRVSQGNRRRLFKVQIGA